MKPNGSNIITEAPPRSDLSLAIEQVKSPLIYILLAAAGVTFYLGDLLDAGVILIAVVINTILGYLQERKAQKSIQALKNVLTPTARILKNGKVETIDARDIDVADIVILHTGDKVPADGSLTEAVHLYVNESMLTGESMPVEKNTGKEKSVFAGTIVTSGRGQFKVTGIGMDTRLGGIATTLTGTTEPLTPLQLQLSGLAKFLAILVVVICGLIFGLGILRGQDLALMFSLAVAIAVSAIPEGMVVSLTVILSAGMQRILKRRALVRKLVSAETLGSVTVLCVDKTGTLTEGIMKVVKHHVTDAALAIQASVYANNMENPIDMALWEWVQGQKNVDPQEMSESTRTHEIPFHSAHKYILVENAKGIWVKGAAEVLLSKSTLKAAEKSKWMSEVNTMAHEGLRVIGLAWKTPHKGTNHDRDTEALQFLGIIGVSDPIRNGVESAIHEAENAGVAVKVITGDYLATSESILSRIGIKIRNPEKEIMEGKELDEITDEDLARRVAHIRLFCRVTPEHKLKIVSALQKNGEVVAMTGDGVNDALALKKSDIGVVVATASDVAREIADLILLDSSFATIVATIEEGRVIFDNIRKVVLYLLSDAYTEMFLITAAIVFGLPLPLTAIQILWINILSDGFPVLALAFEPKEQDVMSRRPRGKSATIFSTRMQIMSVVASFSKAVFALLVFIWALTTTKNPTYAQTLSFAIVGTGSLFYVFSMRSMSKSIIHTNHLKNYWLLVAVGVGLTLQMAIIYQPTISSIFKTYPLGLSDWGIVGTSAVLLIGIIEAMKHTLKK